MSKEEFEVLYNEHFDSIRNYIFYRSGDSEIATDIAQETFLKVWEKKFDIKSGKIKNLMYKIANQFFISHYRKNSKIDSNNHIEFGFVNDTEEKLEFKETKEKIEKTLSIIPEKQRIAFLMNRMENLSYREISDSLGISVKAVEKRISKAISTLRLEILNP